MMCVFQLLARLTSETPACRMTPTLPVLVLSDLAHVITWHIATASTDRHRAVGAVS